MPAIKAFIFDLDGVLVDTAKFHFKAWQRLGQELGIDFQEAQNEMLKGVSRRESLEKILSWGQVELNEAEMQEYMTRKNQWYLESIEDLQPSDALEGALDFLAKAAQIPVQIALGSASKNAVKILDLLGIKEQFACIVDGNHITKSKPDPEVFLRGAEALGLAPEECVVFEDSIAGLEAAQRGGFHRVGIGEAEQLSAPLVLPNLAAIEATAIIARFST